jgi:hypothetical protein
MSTKKLNCTVFSSQRESRVHNIRVDSIKNETFQYRHFLSFHSNRTILWSLGHPWLKRCVVKIGYFFLTRKSKPPCLNFPKEYIYTYILKGLKGVLPQLDECCFTIIPKIPSTVPRLGPNPLNSFCSLGCQLTEENANSSEDNRLWRRPCRPE